MNCKLLFHQKYNIQILLNDLSHLQVPRVIFTSCISFYFAGQSSHLKTLDQVELSSDRIKTFQKVWLHDQFFKLALSGFQIWQIFSYNCLKFLNNQLKFLRSDILQGQYLLLVFSCDCSNIHSFCGLKLTFLFRRLFFSQLLNLW